MEEKTRPTYGCRDSLRIHPGPVRTAACDPGPGARQTPARRSYRPEEGVTYRCPKDHHRTIFASEPVWVPAAKGPCPKGERYLVAGPARPGGHWPRKASASGGSWAISPFPLRLADDGGAAAQPKPWAPQSATAASFFLVLGAIVCVLLLGDRGSMQAKIDRLHHHQPPVAMRHRRGADHDAEPAVPEGGQRVARGLRKDGHGTLALELLQDDRRAAGPHHDLAASCAPGT